MMTRVSLLLTIRLLCSLFFASSVSAIGPAFAISHSASLLPPSSGPKEQVRSPPIPASPLLDDSVVTRNLTRQSAAAAASVPLFSSPTRHSAFTRSSCYPPAAYTAEPSLFACLDTLLLYREDSQYHHQITYCTESGGSCRRRVPLIYGDSSCLLILAALSGPRYDRFSLADTFDAVQSMMRDCLVTAPPGARYGGLVSIGHNQGFFISVAGRPHIPGNQTGDDGGGVTTDQDEVLGEIEAGYDAVILDFAQRVIGPKET